MSGLLFVAFPLHATTYVAQEGGPVSCTMPTTAVPVWGKLVLKGDTVTCYYATGVSTPSSWIQIGKPETIDFINNPLLIGMFVTSHSTTAITTANMDHVTISPAPTYMLADSDIGAPAYMGAANHMPTTWTISGSGANVGGSTDQCNFQPWLVWGDCSIICRITSISADAATPKVGIMIRDGYNSGSDYALFCVQPGLGADFQYRLGFNDNGDVTQLVAPPAPGVKSSIAIGYSPTGTTAYTVRP